MKFELFVALRYLRARRKQAFISIVTLISVLGVAAGVTALIIALALNAGFREEFRERILGATSHVNLLRSPQGPLADYRALLERTRQIPQVQIVTPTIYGQALLSSEVRNMSAILKGVSMEEVESLDLLVPQIVEGDLDRFDLTGPPPAIILGNDLARSLGVLAGERVRAIGLGGELSPLGRMPRIETFEVVAIFQSGLWEYDANWALIPLKSAQRFFGFHPDEVSALEFRIQDIFAASDVAEEIREAVGPGYSTNTWIELNRPLFSALELEKFAMFIAIGLIVLVASLNIVSTLTLMVMEKNRDIAIIAAMGGTGRTVMTIFMLEGLIIGAVGTLVGDLLGIAAVWYLDTYRVFQLEPQVYAIPYVPFQLNWSDLLLVSVVAILISFLATFYPARAASRLDPVQALRYE